MLKFIIKPTQKEKLDKFLNNYTLEDFGTC